MRILIISPVRNEEGYIGETLDSIIRQTVLPKKWLIVDDGSTDNTKNIIKRYQIKAPFIEYIHSEDRGFRLPGKGVVDAFYVGYDRIDPTEYDIICKMDGDIKLTPKCLEQICLAFKDDHKLGITGGCRYEEFDNSGELKRVLVPRGFVSGSNKFYRRTCFDDIGGLINRAGWDGVDTIRATMKGWKTGELDDVQIIHLKPTGMSEGEGLKKACLKYGDVSYYMGGYFWYFILRMLGRSFEYKNIKIGQYMLKGYFNSLLKRKQRETKDFRKFLKRIQIKNMYYWLKLSFKINKRRLI